MAKVTNPLGGTDAKGTIGKALTFRRGGVATKYHTPRDPNTALQQAARVAFKEMVMSYLTQEQADLLYAAIVHLHDDTYSPLGHGHDHGGLSGLSDDDHTQYHNNTRGDARYSLLGHEHKNIQVFGTHYLSGTILASTTMTFLPLVSGFVASGNNIGLGIAGTMKNLRFKTVGAQPGTGSLVVTLYVNSVATALTLTVAAGAAGATFTDLTHSVAIVASDIVRVDIKNNATAASAPITFLSLQCEMDSTG